MSDGQHLKWRGMPWWSRREPCWAATLVVWGILLWIAGSWIYSVVLPCR